MFYSECKTLLDSVVTADNTSQQKMAGIWGGIMQVLSCYLFPDLRHI